MNAAGPEHAAAEQATPPARIRPEHDRPLRRRAASPESGIPVPAQVHRTLAVQGDFSGVRVHADEESAGLAQTFGADAFTYSSRLFFGTGRHRPATPASRQLLRHESLHAMQQSAAVDPPDRIGEPD